MIKKDKRDRKDLLIILRIKKNKNLEDFIIKFNGIAKEITFVPIEGNVSSSILDIRNKNLFKNTILKEASSLKEAIMTYSNYENSRILICGSLYLVSEALRID